MTTKFRDQSRTIYRPDEPLYRPNKLEITDQLFSDLDLILDDIRTLQASGTKWVSPAVAATTANLTISTLTAGSALDGRTLAAADRVLVKDQTTASQNGVYVIGASGAPTRATDADEGSELKGLAIFVSNGTANGGTQWVSSAVDSVITIGTTALPFRLISDQRALNAQIAANTSELLAARGTLPATVYASLAARLDAITALVGSAGTGKLDASIYNARFYQLTLPGWKGQTVIRRDAKGRRWMVRGMRESGVTFDARGPQFKKQYIDLPGWTQVTKMRRDRKGRLRIIDGVRLVNGQLVKVGGATTSVVASATPSTPTDTTIKPNRFNLTRIGKLNRAMDSAASWWSSIARQVDKHGLVGGSSSKGENSAFPDSSAIVISSFDINNIVPKQTIIGYHFNIDDHDTPAGIPDARTYAVAGWPSNLRQPANVPLIVLHSHHGDGTSGYGVKMFRDSSLDPALMGPMAKIFEVPELSYLQPWRYRSSPNKIRVFMRHSNNATSGFRPWLMAWSDNNMEDGLPNWKDIWVPSGSPYMLSWPVRGRDRDVFVFHTHPAEASPAELKALRMVFQDHDGRQWSFSAGGVGAPINLNIFAEGAVPPDVFGTMTHPTTGATVSVSDIIFDPTVSLPPGFSSASGATCRMTSMAQVATDEIQVGGVWFPTRPTPSADFSKSRGFTFRVAFGGSSPVISAVTWLGEAGTSQTEGNGYCGGVAVLKKDLVAFAVMEPFNMSGIPTTSSVLRVCNTATGAAVQVEFELGQDDLGRPIKRSQYVSTSDIYRPIPAIKDVWDGTKYEHDLGDFFVVNEASEYSAYTDFKADQLIIKTPTV